MKKEQLRKQIFHTAFKIVEDEGHSELTARKIATKCDCALGSIYTAFGNLQDLQLHINAAILSRLYDLLHKQAEEKIAGRQPLKELFRGLGLVYFEFAKEHVPLWKALFEYLPVEEVPDWYSIRAKEGIYRLADRLAAAYQLEKGQAKKAIGFFWSSIHGMSAILLNRKMEMVSELFQDEYLAQYVDYSLHGLLTPAEEARLPTP